MTGVYGKSPAAAALPAAIGERSETPDWVFVLGAADPEMNAIEALLSRCEVPFVRAAIDGKRVYPANAYAARAPRGAVAALQRGGEAYLVECVGQAPPGAARIDLHHPGDPGYGKLPQQYWQASSIGQTVAVLAAGIDGAIVITPQMRMIAAADHCLGAAYAGACPGVVPDALLDWQVASRAAFEGRPAAAVMRDVDAARRVLREAPHEQLSPGVYAADLREWPTAELPLAAARAGQCCLSAVKTRDGRTKIGCLVGSPAQISAFMRVWAPAHRLTDIYGDPMRGFAGAYLP